MSNVPTNDRPNILFVLTDQQRADSMRAYGNRWIETPAMDSIADRSFVFESAYVTQPVCSPSRASILTGLYPHTTGVVRNEVRLPEETRTIAELLPDEYHCAYYGKWHLGDDVVSQHGFEDWLAIEDWHQGNYSRPEYREIEAHYHEYLRDNGIEPPPPTISYQRWFVGTDLPEELTQAAYLRTQACRFIRERAQLERPWLLFLSFFEPHPPYTGPLDGLYDPASIEVGPAFLQKPVGGAAANRMRADHYMAGNMSPIGVASRDIHDTTTELGWRKLRAQYFANVTMVDRQLETILQELEASGQAGNTIIVFTSDHGEMAGDHGMMEKMSLYEEASRVPLLIHLPGQDQQVRVISPVSHVDLVPTLLELSGGSTGIKLDGSSWAGALSTGAAPPARDVFVQRNGRDSGNHGNQAINDINQLPWRSVITPDRWKLNLCAGDVCELFDLNSDPHEMQNLFERPNMKGRIVMMTEKIRRWQAETGDDAELPEIAR